MRLPFIRPAGRLQGACGQYPRAVSSRLPPELADLVDAHPGAHPAANSAANSAAGPGTDPGAELTAGIPRPSGLRGMLKSWAPAGIAPALWAFAVMPSRLTWTSEISSRLFSLLSPVYGDLTAIEGYGEALELALLDLRGSPQHILDVGCGTGFATQRLKRRYPNAHVVGVDVSTQMLSQAQRNAGKEGLDIAYQLGDAARLPFPEASFDLVLTQNAPPFCDELLRVLRPRGKAVVVFSFGGPWVELAWASLADRFERSGASQAKGRRGGFGFYGIARKRA